MPSWLARRAYLAPMPLDVDSDGEESYPGGPIRFKYHNPLLGCLGAECLPNAIPIPGSGHTVHNCMKSLPESMDHWDTFFKYLKIIKRLLTHPGRRERMVARCVMGTPFAEYEKDLLTCFCAFVRATLGGGRLVLPEGGSADWHYSTLLVTT